MQVITLWWLITTRDTFHIVILFSIVFCYIFVKIPIIPALNASSNTEQQTPSGAAAAVVTLLISTTSVSVRKSFSHHLVKDNTTVTYSKNISLLFQPFMGESLEMWPVFVNFSGCIFFGINLWVGEADRGADWASNPQRSALFCTQELALPSRFICPSSTADESQHDLLWAWALCMTGMCCLRQPALWLIIS